MDRMFQKRYTTIKIGLVFLFVAFIFSLIFFNKTKVNVLIDTQDIHIEYGETLNVNKLNYISADNIIFKINNMEKDKRDVIFSTSIDYSNVVIGEKGYPEIGEYSITFFNEKPDKNFVIKFNNDDKVKINVIVEDTTAPIFHQKTDVVETYKDVPVNLLSYFSVSDLSEIEFVADDSNVNWSKAGEYPAVVTATDIYGNKSEQTLNVTINEPTITLNKDSISLYTGKTFTLNTEINGKDNFATFSSENNSIATVSDKGVIKAVGVGTTNIIASANGVSAKCKVVVKEIKTFFTATGGVSDDYMLSTMNELAYLPANAYNFFKNNGWTYYLVNGNMRGEDHSANMRGTIWGVTYWDGTQKVYISSAHIKDVLLHELGHVADCHLGRISSGEFSGIFYLERDNYLGNIPGASSHHVNDLREYFADSFEAYLKWPSKLKAACPKTYEYMNSFIHGL